jgi:hypothetical protein
MRRTGGVWAVLLCVAATGCVGGPLAFLQPDAPSHIESNTPHAVGGFGNAFGNSLAVDSVPGVYVESVLFERTVGDRVLNRDIWLADISGISPKTRVLLEENGLKVAVIGGNLPPEFQRLLESGEGAVSPQGLTFASRTEAVIPTVGPIATCEYRVLIELSGQRDPRKLLTANGGFQIQPVRAADGRVKVRCEPQLQHGERQDWIRPAADATGFALKSEIPHESYPSLGFEVSLNPGDYLVIGWLAADEGEPSERSLGSALFCVEGKGETRQRVLVIRAGCRGESPSDLPSTGRPSAVRPIAAHASRW